MRTLFLAFSLVGGLFATNDGAQDAVQNGYNNFKQGIEERQHRREARQPMTSEEQELRDLLHSLLEEVDFKNLEAEEKIEAMEAIIEQLVVKADELGVDVTPFVEKFEERVANYELHNSEEWILFREYMDELKATYDFENLTPEEKIALMDELHELMLAKAEELGIDITDIIERQLDRKDHYEFMHSEEMEEFKAYLDELKSSYDFENMTEEEKVAALEEIKELVEAKAEELGIDIDDLPKPKMGPRQKGRVEGFKRGFRAGRAYERNQDAPQTEQTDGEAA